MTLWRRLAIAVIAALLPATALAASSVTLDRIKAHGAMVMAVDAANPPFSFIKDGQLDGFDIDVAREIAQRLGVKLETVTPAWDVITAGHWQQRWDISVGSMAPTKARSEVLDFPAIYYYAPAVIVVNKDNQSVKAASDLDGKRVGVEAASVYESYLDRTLVLDAPGAPPIAFAISGAKAVSFEHESDAFVELAFGDGVRLDAVIAGYLAASAQIHQGRPFRIVGKPLFAEPIAVAIDKGDAAFGSAIARIVARMHSDGTLRKLSLKWLAADVTTPTPSG
jgi:polar amino acid transport system substrate-binding protein